MPGKTFGRLFVENGRYVIDADPHVMARVRALFESSQVYVGGGRHTHKPVTLARTLAGSRDLLWFCERYPLTMEPEVMETITKAANEYDAICNAVATADQDKTYRASPNALRLAVDLRDYQIQFNNYVKNVGGRTLCADKMGLGKTIQAISLLAEPEARPALVVVPTHLCAQWEKELKRVLPDAKTHIIRGYKNYDLPAADVYVTSYPRLQPWQDTLIREELPLRTLILDEVQELRRVDTGKRDTARVLSSRAAVVAGLSGTPIYNYGSEIWSVIDAIAPDRLGRESDFLAEWCYDKKVREPTVLHSFLKSQGLMLRRTPEDVGLQYGECSKHVYTLDADLDKLKEIENVAKMLALTVCSGHIGRDEGQASKDFDWKLRHATGVAKARPAAEFVKLLLDEKEKVILAGWHHDVYDIWLKELAAFNPVEYTGRALPGQKDDAYKRFIEDDSCRVLLLSLRSGAGIDGFQHVCNTIVVGELDWSPHVMDQLQYRVNRPGQQKHVQMFFLTVNDGADPFMTKVLNVKRSQHDGVVEGSEAEATILDGGASFDRGRVREMAAAYLQSIGEAVPEPVKEDGLLGEVLGALRRVRVPISTEDEMQRALWGVLPKMLAPDVQLEREVRYGKRGRLDFLAVRDQERVAIECKIDSTGRADVYRQVRKYAQEAQISSLALFAPWTGIPSFVVDGTPVVVVDYSVAAL